MTYEKDRIRELEAARDAVQAVVDYLDAELETQQREVARIEAQITAVKRLGEETA